MKDITKDVNLVLSQLYQYYFGYGEVNLWSSDEFANTAYNYIQSHPNEFVIDI